MLNNSVGVCIQGVYFNSSERKSVTANIFLCLSEELKYTPCIHTPTEMFNIKIITSSQECIHRFRHLKTKLYTVTQKYYLQRNVWAVTDFLSEGLKYVPCKRKEVNRRLEKIA
jgi:hypothetical protein